MKNSIAFNYLWLADLFWETVLEITLFQRLLPLNLISFHIDFIKWLENVIHKEVLIKELYREKIQLNQASDANVCFYFIVKTIIIFPHIMRTK